MLVGELAMVFGRLSVILCVFVFAHLVMMGRLMMVVRSGVVVSGGGLVMLARRMRGRFRHDFVLLPESRRRISTKPS
jgi:hypothetical protein